jgi:thiamine transporter ThiT
MAICAALDLAGQIVQQATIPLEQCTGFVLLDKADWVQYGLIQSLITIPEVADFRTAWMAGFVTPMVVGLVAYCVGKLCSIWDR